MPCARCPHYPLASHARVAYRRHRDRLPPETDEHGFAPTRMVRVKMSKAGVPLGFQRCYMKPADVGFPGQWRDVSTDEHERLLASYVRRRIQGEDMRKNDAPERGEGSVAEAFSKIDLRSSFEGLRGLSSSRL